MKTVQMAKPYVAGLVISTKPPFRMTAFLSDFTATYGVFTLTQALHVVCYPSALPLYFDQTTPDIVRIGSTPDSHQPGDYRQRRSAKRAKKG